MKHADEIEREFYNGYLVNVPKLFQIIKKQQLQIERLSKDGQTFCKRETSLMEHNLELQRQVNRYEEALKYVDVWAKGDMREVARKALEGK